MGTDLQPSLDRAGADGFRRCGVVLDESGVNPDGALRRRFSLAHGRRSPRCDPFRSQGVPRSKSDGLRPLRARHRRLTGAITRIGTTLHKEDSAMAADDDLTTNHEVVSHEEWLAARRALLEREKAFTRQCDEMSRLQRSLPWERVTKEYIFEGQDGRETLADIFAGRSQLIVYHFMFHPDDNAGCPHCSLRADGFEGIGVHLNHRDVTMVVVSRAPYAN